MKKGKTKTLVECAVLIALSTVLSMIKVWTMPLGGSVTLLSMLPVCYISIRHGLKNGLFASFVYACVQLFLDIGPAMGWGLTPMRCAGMIAFDYIIAFTVLGIAGIFREKGMKGVMAGTFLAVFLRFVCHIVSGALVFDIWLPDGWSSPWIYSVVYNGTLMLPEVIITIAGAVVCYKVLLKRKF